MLKRKPFLILLFIIVSVLAITVPALAITLPSQGEASISLSDISKVGGYVVVEPSGTCENNGMVQIRLAMYLYPSDYGYEKQHVQVPVVPAGGYTGKVDSIGQPIDINDYNKWIASLPKVWQDNPFHNHFIYVEPTMTDEQIMNIAQSFLVEAYVKWSASQPLDLKNPAVAYPKTIDSARLSAVNTKVQHLKTTSLMRENTLGK
jgi:hypothetical protein